MWNIPYAQYSSSIHIPAILQLTDTSAGKSFLRQPLSHNVAEIPGGCSARCIVIGPHGTLKDKSSQQLILIWD